MAFLKQGIAVVCSSNCNNTTGTLSFFPFVSVFRCYNWHPIRNFPRAAERVCVRGIQFVHGRSRMVMCVWGGALPIQGGRASKKMSIYK